MSQLENTVLQIIKENNLRYKWNEKISLELKDIKLDSKKSRKDCLIASDCMVIKNYYIAFKIASPIALVDIA